jgi:excisionase family DNA binding protein
MNAVKLLKPSVTDRAGEAIESLLTPEEVMSILKIEDSHLNKLLSRRELRPVKVGKLNRFHPSEIRAYIERGRK